MTAGYVAHITQYRCSMASIQIFCVVLLVVFFAFLFLFVCLFFIIIFVFSPICRHSLCASLFQIQKFPWIRLTERPIVAKALRMTEVKNGFRPKNYHHSSENNDGALYTNFDKNSREHFDKWLKV